MLCKVSYTGNKIYIVLYKISIAKIYKISKLTFKISFLVNKLSYMLCKVSYTGNKIYIVSYKISYLAY